MVGGFAKAVEDELNLTKHVRLASPPTDAMAVPPSSSVQVDPLKNRACIRVEQRGSVARVNNLPNFMDMLRNENISRCVDKVSYNAVKEQVMLLSEARRVRRGNLW
ncbi:hypothetical protein V6N11_064504 [Hibiscus sabdariffa]|uniref:Uncharacterized protein n=1 Tax=Hibiscus sabdariffa TaxID=183260 RepID=A0ABR1ZG19_9ROSI